MAITAAQVRLVVTSVVVAGLTHCTASKQPPPGVNQRDSAGIVIVEHDDTLPTDLEHWTIDSMPALDLGVDGRSGAELFGRVYDLDRFSDGGVLVIDVFSYSEDKAVGPGGIPVVRGSKADLAIKLYDSTGRFSQQIGRVGDGPGEFRAIRWLHAGVNDSIWIYDDGHRRLSIFDRDGRLAREVNLADRKDLPNLGFRGQYPNGDLLIDISGFQELPAKKTRIRFTRTLARLSPSGALLDTIGTFPADESAMARIDGGVRSWSVAFPLGLSLAMVDSTLFVGTRESYEIRGLGPDGKLRKIIRRLIPPVPVSAEMKADHEKRKGPGYDPLYPDHLPAYGDFLTDGSAYLWVEEYQPYRPAEAPTRWLVFEPDGRLVATAELPVDRRISRLGPDWLAAVVKDSNDVDHAVIYRVKRSPPNDRSAGH